MKVSKLFLILYDLSISAFPNYLVQFGLKGQATVGPTVKSGQWQAPRINGFSELSQVMSRSVTDCKHAGCWNQLIYWNLCTFVVEDDWCKILKICTL